MKNFVKKISLPLAVIGCVYGSNVNADSKNNNPHFYVGATYGQSDINDDNFDDDNDASYSVFAGYDFGVSIGVEAAYVDLGEGDGPGFRANAETLDLSVVGNFIDTQTIDVYARAGLSLWETELDTALGDTSNDGTEFFWGVGTEIYLTEAFALRLEYTRYEVEIEDDEGSVFTEGRDYNLNRLNAGIKFSF